MSVKILIVDDSATIRMMIKKAVGLSVPDLEDVIEASDGISALAQLADHEVDIMLVDINMPRMNGMQLIARLKDSPRFADIPVVVISTEGSQERIQELEKYGVAGYIRKPFRPEQLKEVLSQILEISHECQTSLADGCDF